MRGRDLDIFEFWVRSFLLTPTYSYAFPIDNFYQYQSSRSFDPSRSPSDRQSRDFRIKLVLSVNSSMLYGGVEYPLQPVVWLCFSTDLKCLLPGCTAQPFSLSFAPPAHNTSIIPKSVAHLSCNSASLSCPPPSTPCLNFVYTTTDALEKSTEGKFNLDTLEYCPP